MGNPYMKTLSSSKQKRLWRGAVFCFLLAFLLSACNTRGNEPSSHALSCTTVLTNSTGQGADAAVLANVPLPGQPFKAVATDDGQWIFVSVDANDAASSGIAVLHNRGNQICLQRIIHLSESPLGMVLTHDDRLLLVADFTNVTFVDVAQAESSAQKAIFGSVLEQSNSLAIEVALSQDERAAFVANENNGTVGVIDMRRVRTHDFSSDALIGLIPVNKGPLGVDSGAVGLAVSPDNRFLYVTSRIDTGDHSPQGNICDFGYPPGTLSVVDIGRAEQNPTHAVLSHVFVGCGPVRVILSPAGDTAWVTIQEDNVVKAFSTARLQSDPAHAQLIAVPVGAAPTGEALIDNGAVLVVTNSNRFLQPQTPQTLTVLDTKRVLTGQGGVLGTIHVEAFPRELLLEANGQTLLLTNYNSDTLSIIDVVKLPGPA